MTKYEHFYRGDKLKAINILDEDGEPCDGGLKMDEIVTMMDRSSEDRPVIIVKRENGRQFQWEKSRFVLHERYVIPKETDYNKDEVNLAKNLLGFYKEAREQQGVNYTVWDDASSDTKALFLHMARQLIIVEGFVITGS